MTTVTATLPHVGDAIVTQDNPYYPSSVVGTLGSVIEDSDDATYAEIVTTAASSGAVLDAVMQTYGDVPAGAALESIRVVGRASTFNLDGGIGDRIEVVLLPLGMVISPTGESFWSTTAGATVTEFTLYLDSTANLSFYGFTWNDVRGAFEENGPPGLRVFRSGYNGLPGDDRHFGQLGKSYGMRLMKLDLIVTYTIDGTPPPPPPVAGVYRMPPLRQVQRGDGLGVGGVPRATQRRTRQSALRRGTPIY